MIESNTIIIILLSVLIALYLIDMYNRECFSSIGNTFFNVDYNTMDVKCDDLTGSTPCVVKTVKPKRKEVCNKKLQFINPVQRIREMNARATAKNMDQLSVEMGMSLDQLDMGNSQDDDVNYDTNANLEREKNNTKIKNNIKSKNNEENTLSDIDDQLITLN